MADGTQYLIELSAKFTGGDAAVSTLSDLGDRMLKAGANSEALERAAKAMGVSMEEADAAVKSANSALEEGERKYKAAEVAADRAAKAVERVGVQAAAQWGKLDKAMEVGDTGGIAAAEAAIAKLAAKQGELAASAAAAKEALKGEAAAVDGLKGKATAAATSQDALKKGLANVKSATDTAKKAEAAAAGTGKLQDIAQAFGKMGGPVGATGQEVLGLAGSFGKLGSAMGSAGPYVAVALAIVAIATAAIAATIAIAKWGVSMADANRTQSLLTAGIARSVKGGEELEKEYSKITAVLPVTNDELAGMAKGLADSGLRGKDLSNALERSAVAAAKLKFGPDFQKAMLGLDFQAKKLDSNLQDTFGGLKIEGLLGGIQTLIALFDSTEASGKAMKFLFESLFQPLIDGATEAIPKIERLFLYAIIWALKAWIALKPYKKEMEAIAKVLLIGAAIIVGVLIVAIASLVVAIVAAIAIIGALGYALYKILEVLVLITVGLVKGLYIMVTTFATAGYDFVAGLIKGILSGATAIIDAMVGVVKGGYDAVSKFLKRGSPSKLMMEVGSDVAEGYTGGVEDGSADAQGAMEAMVAPPSTTASAVSGAAGGASIVIQQMTVTGEGAKELALDFIDQITRLLEGDARALGGGETAHA